MNKLFSFLEVIYYIFTIYWNRDTCQSKIKQVMGSYLNNYSEDVTSIVPTVIIWKVAARTAFSLDSI